MTFFANVSELAHEFRHAAGTVLTILGSHLEAQERARVDEVGPQWLTEFEEQRDSLDAEQLFECVQPGCDCHDDERYTPIPEDSAAVSAAADPSPTVGGEGSGGASDILQSAPPERSTDPGEVAAPSPGEQVDEDDLAAHIMGDFVSGQEVDPLTATLIDAISSLIARALLADFNITRK